MPIVDRLRKMLPLRENISEYEHPLTREEFERMVAGFEVEGTRYFRLPIVPLIEPPAGQDVQGDPQTERTATRDSSRASRLATITGVKLTKI